MRLTLRGFMSHADVVLDFPDTGVALVTGPNGAGKSALIEGIAWTAHGTTLRASAPYRDGVECVARLDSHKGLWIERRRTAGGQNRLTWAMVGGVSEQWQTVTKADQALAVRVGSLEAWRRTAVFSSQDAAGFAAATDGERKRLLEGILGLHRFDTALSACRVDLKRAREVETNARRRVAVVEERIVGAERRVADALAAAGPDVSDTELDALKDAIASTAEERAEVDVALEVLLGRRQAARHDVTRTSALRDVARRSEGLLGVGRCPTCEQAIGDEARVRIAEAVRTADKARQDAVEAANAIEQEIGASIARLEDDRHRLAAVASAADAAVRDANRVRAQHRDEATRLGSARVALDTALAEVDEVRVGAQTAAAIVAELEAAEVALGLRGIRAHVIEGALKGIEAVANARLAQIAGPSVSVELSACRTTATGGVEDRIALIVHGAGGGLGYAAASGGERRRIDVAILLALTEIAAGAAGQEPGPLFLDEVFDTLDADGVDAVAGVLGEMSVDRLILVVTHSPRMADALRPWCARRLHVEDGVIDG